MFSELCLVHLLQLCLGLIEFHFHDYTTMFCNVLGVSQQQIFCGMYAKGAKTQWYPYNRNPCDNTTIVSQVSATDQYSDGQDDNTLDKQWYRIPRDFMRQLTRAEMVDMKPLSLLCCVAWEQGYPYG